MKSLLICSLFDRRLQDSIVIRSRDDRKTSKCADANRIPKLDAVHASCEVEFAMSDRRRRENYDISGSNTIISRHIKSLGSSSVPFGHSVTLCNVLADFSTVRFIERHIYGRYLNWFLAFIRHPNANSHTEVNFRQHSFWEITKKHTNRPKIVYFRTFLRKILCILITSERLM